jgi:hypothetical protein
MYEPKKQKNQSFVEIALPTPLENIPSQKILAVSKGDDNLIFTKGTEVFFTKSDENGP